MTLLIKHLAIAVVGSILTLAILVAWDWASDGGIITTLGV